MITTSFSLIDTKGIINGFQIHVDEQKMRFRHLFRCLLGNQSSSNVPKRVKELCVIPNLNPNRSGQIEPTSLLWFASVDSSGILSLWFWESDKNQYIDQLKASFTIDTQARITSMDCNKPVFVAESSSDNEMVSPRKAEINQKVISVATRKNNRSIPKNLARNKKLQDSMQTQKKITHRIMHHYSSRKNKFGKNIVL